MILIVSELRFTTPHDRFLFEDCELALLIPFSNNLTPKELVNVTKHLQLRIEIREA